MFPFRKKTKTVPRNLLPRHKGGFVKKSIARREVPFPSADKDESSGSAGFGWVYAALWTVFFSVTAYMLVFSPLLRLDTVRVEGSSEVSARSIEQCVRQRMSETFFGFIPENTLLTFPRERIESGIENTFKKIRSAEATRSFPNTLEIHVQERKTGAVWCSDSSCFFMDENGYAYDSVDDVGFDGDGETALVRVTDASGEPVNADDPPLDRDSAVFLGDIRERLRQSAGIEIETDATTPSRFSDQVMLKTKEGWLLYLDVRVPMEKSLRTLGLLFKKEIAEDRRQRLKYIDLRTENRVYYSVDGETVSAPDPAVDSAASQPTVPAPVADDKSSKKEKKK